MQLLGTCSQLLVDLLQPHGIIAVHNESHVSLPDYPTYRFALQTYKSGQKTVLLEAMCEFGPGKVIKEGLAGIGETQAEAIMDAQQNFVNCVFHVWISALFGKSNQYANEYLWKVNGVDRQVTIGLPCGRGDFDVAIYNGWQEVWYQAIRSLPLSCEMHWASLCYVHQAGKFIACDTLFNNKACEALKENVLRFDWPARNSFYSVRQFMIISPITYST